MVARYNRATAFFLASAGRNGNSYLRYGQSALGRFAYDQPLQNMSKNKKPPPERGPYLVLFQLVNSRNRFL